jgi:AcrR family transcriptional regulator
MKTEGPRQRRARGEPRRLLLEAAVELFNARGYRASTREIADRADVSETLLFRNFGDKAGLFREAMVKPFVDFVDQFAAAHEHPGRERNDDVFEVSLEFIGPLFDLFRSHRGLVYSVWGNAGDDGFGLAAAGVERDIWAAFSKLVEVGRLSAGRPTRNEISTRAVVSMVAGMAVADRAFEPGTMPSRDLIVYELAQIATYGRVYRHPVFRLESAGADFPPASSTG